MKGEKFVDVFWCFIYQKSYRNPLFGNK